MAAFQQSAFALRPSLTSSSARSLRSSTFLPPLRLPTRERILLYGGRRGGVTMLDKAAINYANALSDLAESHGTLDATFSDMEKVSQLFSDPEVFSFFTNPVVDTSDKEEILDKFASASGIHENSVNFLKILVEKNRVSIIEDIIQQFEASYDSATGTEAAIVTSVVPLDPNDLAQIAKIIQKFTGANNVRIKTALDESLIAGFTIRYGPSYSYLIDMSVKKQLDDITREVAMELDVATV